MSHQSQPSLANTTQSIQWSLAEAFYRLFDQPYKAGPELFHQSLGLPQDFELAYNIEPKEHAFQYIGFKLFWIEGADLAQKEVQSLILVLHLESGQAQLEMVQPQQRTTQNFQDQFNQHKHLYIMLFRLQLHA